MRELVAELMATVDLPVDMLDSHAFELSGGQRQRVSIARALAMEPEVILADEPTSMLDVSVRIGVLNLMRRLRDERGISMLYITHDLASARYVADRTTVMFAGELVESGDVHRPSWPGRLTPTPSCCCPPYRTPSGPAATTPSSGRGCAPPCSTPESCPFDGDPNQVCSRTEPVRHDVGDRPRTGTGSAATCTGRPRTSPRVLWPWTRSRGSHRRRRPPIRSPPNL